MSDGLDDAADVAAEHVAASAADPSARAAKARPSRKAELRPDVKEGHCANCNTKLQGAVCHHCGQLADEFHRPVRGLVGEIIEGLLALDGRVARTIPNLLLRPGRITRAYLKGQRARFMPPFRLYIVASLIFFLLVPLVANSVTGPDPQVVRGAIEEAGNIEAQIDRAEASGEFTPEQAAEARQAFEESGLATLFGTRNEDAAEPPASESELVDTPPDGALPEGVESDAGSTVSLPDQTPNWLGERINRVAEDPAAWLERAQSWVPRIMFVMVPVYALLLSLTYAWRRGFYLYDHLIVSVHFHAALFLSMAVFYLLADTLSGSLMFLAGLVYSHAYLYRLHRVVYERGRFTSILRTVTLTFVYGIILGIGLVATLLISALVA